MKDMKQQLWERGRGVDGMGTGEKLEPERNMATALGELPDFHNEKTAFQHSGERGHILVLSPKCHPEVAGSWMEYSWVLFKQEFRGNMKDKVAKNLHASILESPSFNLSTVGGVRWMLRTTRSRLVPGVPRRR